MYTLKRLQYLSRVIISELSELPVEYSGLDVLAVR